MSTHDGWPVLTSDAFYRRALKQFPGTDDRRNENDRLWIEAGDRREFDRLSYMWTEEDMFFCTIDLVRQSVLTQF